MRDIEIHSGCNNWYIDVNSPPRSYRVDIGYVTKSGRFYMLCRSNVVTTPRANMSDQIDENWAEVQQKLDKIYALSGGYDKNASSMELRKLFEERLRRPMSSQVVTSLGSGAFQAFNRASISPGASSRSIARFSASMVIRSPSRTMASGPPQ